MKNMLPLLVTLICLFAQTPLHSQNSASSLKNGDLIFISNPTGQGQAIQLATHSKYTHIGVIFIEQGKPYVYHAVEPVTKSSLEDFIKMSRDGKYELKRLKSQEILTSSATEKMRQWCISKLGIHYDVAFNWDDTELYCSEFVWKLYHEILKVEIGKTRPLKTFDLTHPAVKSKLAERYGSHIPLNEPMISPGDMYASDLIK